MLKRFYANNYRCLVNFEIKFGKLVLLLGENGGGKSTIFDALYKIRNLLVNNARIGDVFSTDDRTRWVEQNDLTFELDVENNEGLFTYRLVISYKQQDLEKSRVEHEELSLNGKPLFLFKKGEVQLYHDDHVPGPHYSFDWTVSGLSMVAPRNDNKRLTWFKNWMEKMTIVCLHPKAMKSETSVESKWLDREGTNFSSWYRYFHQEHSDKAFSLTQKLRDIIPGFSSLNLVQEGKQRILKVGFEEKTGGGRLQRFFDFEEISDGQRVIIVLYSLLFGLQNSENSVFLDEPENYVALSEIQPWLLELNDQCGENIPQAVIISHHPELIDYLGPDDGQWIERDPLGPTRVKNIPTTTEKGVKLSELIARGWTD